MKVTREKLLAKLAQTLANNHLTLVTAESCTGGGLAHLLSMHEQTSSFLERGFVVYSNQAKQQLLQVPTDVLQLYGAVSKEIALAMAKGALQNSCAQVSIATTGIAAPDREEKNLKGIVWISMINSNHKEKTFSLSIDGTRKQFCRDVIDGALLHLLQFLT